jgi:uncharacterized RDD family membrane protein YckC
VISPSTTDFSIVTIVIRTTSKDLIKLEILKILNFVKSFFPFFTHCLQKSVSISFRNPGHLSLIMSTPTVHDSKFRFCPACGAEVDPLAKFCPICGEHILPAAPASHPAYVNIPAPPPAARTGIDNPELITHPGTKYADFGDRVLAFIIDSIFISAIVGLITGMIQYSLTGEFFKWENSGLQMFFSLLYFWAGDYKGQTLGKMLVKIKVVDERTLGAVTPLQALLHILGKVFFLPFDIILGAIIMKDEDEKRTRVRLSQRISRTVVIKA